MRRPFATQTHVTQRILRDIDLPLGLLAPTVVSSLLRTAFRSPRSRHQRSQAISLPISERRIARSARRSAGHPV